MCGAASRLAACRAWGTPLTVELRTSALVAGRVGRLATVLSSERVAFDFLTVGREVGSRVVDDAPLGLLPTFAA